MRPDDVAEALGRMEALKPGIEVRRGAKIAVSQHPAGELVVLRLAHDQCRRGMAVLVRRHSDADPILNGSRDLVAKGLETLVAAVLARKEPGLVRAA